CSCDGCWYRAIPSHVAVARRSPPVRTRRPSVVPSPASALGGHAGGYGRPDALVFFDGIGAWRGTDGSAGVSVDDSGGRRSVLPFTGSVDAGVYRRHGDAGPWIGISGGDGSSGVVCRRPLRSGASSEGLDQPGCDLGGGADSHRRPDSY